MESKKKQQKDMSNSTKRNPVNSGNHGDLQPLKQTFVRAH